MKARRTALLLAALVVVYAVLIGWRGVTLIGDGRPVPVVLGVAVLLLPVVGVWLTVAELRFGRSVEALGQELGAEGGLPVDDLPRRPSGRPERAAADELFARRRDEAKAAPEDWRTWFRLALAYDSAGDRARARRTMRRAIAVHAGRRAD
ncbi:hypothetical protein [Motilibacter deserti]|uniref:Tetratricopeptide repeat protein n=1 Tax=Motilibacter deserti TaxID=2714956 RepID=A0ABX0GRT7_9ACTN|nr:hypothetical protein [Motilibacter deserti]NHC13588.1 hypothetical protein [Motilibacter deserti]